MDDDDNEAPPPPPDHHDGCGTTQPMSSLASEAYLAVRDFMSASLAEAHGERGAAAAHAASAASRVQTAVEAEGALPRGDFGPVCDLLATMFAWKAQALSDALEAASPTDAGAGCLSPSLLSAAALPPPPPPPTLPPPPPPPFRAPPRHHHPQRRLGPSAQHAHLLELPDPPSFYAHQQHQQHQQHYHHYHQMHQQPYAAEPSARWQGGGGGCGGGVGGDDDQQHQQQQQQGDSDEDAALEAELVRRCLRRPHGRPPDPSQLCRVRGLPAAKRELEDAVLLPARLPARLRAALRGVRRPPSTFLLHGPPGTGKTMLVEAVAAAAGASLLCASPSAVLSKWAGESERAVRLLFRAARRLAPCVVFLDEVDALGASRGGFSGGDGGGGGGGGGGGNQDALARRVLTELLVQMSRLDKEEEEGEEAAGEGGGGGRNTNDDDDDDGGDDDRAQKEGGGGGPCGGGGTAPPSRPGAAPPPRQRGVWVFAATNRPADVDPALLRRFERRLAVPLPDAEGRAAFVRAALQELEALGGGGGGGGGAAGAPPPPPPPPPQAHVLSEADVARLAEAARGMSGADLRAAARRAALAPVRELGEQVRRRWQEREEEGGGKRQRRAERDQEEEDQEEVEALCLRPVCAADWDEAIAAWAASSAAGGAGDAGAGAGGGAGGAAAG